MFEKMSDARDTIKFIIKNYKLLTNHKIIIKTFTYYVLK